MEDRAGLKFETFYDWLQSIWRLLKDRQIDKAQKSFPDADIQIYWAGTVIRIDIKPK